MSQWTPGWYADPTDGHAQRYYDGTRWTEHVVDADGARTLRPPPGAPAAAQAAGRQWATQPAYGQAPAAEPQQQQWAAQPAYGQASAAEPQQQQWQAQPDYGQAGYSPSTYGAAPAEVQRPFTLTVGLIVAVVGAVLLLASLFALDFITFTATAPGGAEESVSMSLGDLRSDDLIDTSQAGRAGQYIEFGFIIGLIPLVGAVGWSAFQHRAEPDHPGGRAVTAVTILILAWHLMAMFLWDNEPGVSTSPAIGAWLGVVGYLALAASSWLPHPLIRPASPAGAWQGQASNNRY